MLFFAAAAFLGLVLADLSEISSHRRS